MFDACDLIKQCAADVLFQVDHIEGHLDHASIVAKVDHGAGEDGLWVPAEAEQSRTGSEIGAIDVNKAALFEQIGDWLGRTDIALPVPCCRSVSRDPIEVEHLQ